MAVENRERASRMDMRTPCCRARSHIDYVYEGRPYMEEQVVESFGCGGAGCDNSWYADGTASMIRATVADETGHRESFFFEEGEA
ncbi:hypothetical protein [Brachybacterium sacelli]|uniref:Uncharacterized protein n=1 Tax=Brachybacterium sacelli TaxID=173364 RepID=A0ABS4X5P6_9MICO|nr:hypothetical protein [Brachybacterium sacelli]MBP2383790.1 hypothetical protein [Brachybacterium sacelli]